MQDKIEQLLGLNLPSNIVAMAVGCDESYISQLLSEEGFRERVQVLRLKNVTETAQRDGAYNKIEDALLTKLQESVDNGYIVKPMEVARILAIINAAKRRVAPAEFQNQTQRPVLQLTLPVTIATQFVINSKSQVVEVQGKTIATMPAAGVVAKLEERQKKAEEVTPQKQLDTARAEERLSNLVKLPHLPVHELV